MSNVQEVCCNTCYESLTEEELSVYDIQWQHSGDMYCSECRDCPDDCRQTPCRMSKQEEACEYTHSLYYDDYKQAQEALAYVRKVLEAQACMWYPEEFYTYAIAFVTKSEFLEEEAQEFIQTLSPDAYDFNSESGDEETWEEEDDDDEDELGGFPRVFTEHDKTLALELAENELTIEYINRLEHIATAAHAYYAKNQSEGSHVDLALAWDLYKGLVAVGLIPQ